MDSKRRNCEVRHGSNVSGELKMPSIDEIIEEHARMKRQLHAIHGWVEVAHDSSRNVDESALRFVIEQVARAVAVAFAKGDGVLYADQNQRYAMSDFEKYRALLFAVDVLGDAGMFESPAAESLRDACDRHWRGMSEGEREAFRERPPAQAKPEYELEWLSFSENYRSKILTIPLGELIDIVTGKVRITNIPNGATIDAAACGLFGDSVSLRIAHPSFGAVRPGERCEPFVTQVENV